MKTTFIQRLICGFIKGVISLRVANPKNRFADELITQPITFHLGVT